MALLRSLRHRNYRLFFAGQLVSLVGTWMQSTAQGWLVYRLTGSSLMLGLVGFASLTPVLVLGLFGGVLADRLPKRGLLMAAQTAAMCQAAALAWLTLSGGVQVWQIVACAACLGVVNAVELPARHSFVAEMVERQDLHNAIALNSSIFHLARVLGPVAAGALVAWKGEGWCFAANAASFLAVLAGLALMRFERPAATAAKAGLRSHAAEGVRYACRTPLVRGILLLIASAGLLGASCIVLLPAFAGEVFGRGPQGLGMLTAASGLGSLLGALAMAARRDQTGLGGFAGWGCAALGACLALFSLAGPFWLALALLVPAGFGLMVMMASCNTMLQLACPDDMRGRVMSLYTMLYMGMAPFGALAAGALAQWLGPRAAVGLLGLGCLAGAAALGRGVAREHARSRSCPGALD